MNKRFITHLGYNWLVYLLIAALTVIGWVAVFDVLNQTPYNERVSIIIYSEEWNSYDIGVELNDKKQEITVQPLSSITIEHIAVTKSTLFGRLGTDMIVNDIMIMNAELLDSSFQESITIDPSESFYALDTDKLEAVFGDIQVNYLIIDGKAYGIYLNDANDGVTNNFERHYTGRGTFILFFSRESVNIDRMNALGNEGDRAALDVARYFLEVQDEKAL